MTTTKKRAKRRTVRSVLREVFPEAPGDVLEDIEERLGVSTLKELGELQPAFANQEIYQAFAHYANKLVADPGIMPKTFAEKLREHVEADNVSYHHMFSQKGMAYLALAIHEVSGNNDYGDILDALSQ